MNKIELLVKALSEQYRYKSTRGLVTTEDLFSLSLNELDTIAVHLYNQVKETEVSFIKETVKDSESNSKLQVVVLVIKYLKDKQEKESKRRENSRRKKELASLLAEKQKAKELSMSEEEILAQLQALDSE